MSVFALRIYVEPTSGVGVEMGVGAGVGEGVGFGVGEGVGVGVGLGEAEGVNLPEASVSALAFRSTLKETLLPSLVQIICPCIYLSAGLLPPHL